MYITHTFIIINVPISIEKVDDSTPLREIFLGRKLPDIFVFIKNLFLRAQKVSHSREHQKLSKHSLPIQLLENDGQRVT